MTAQLLKQAKPASCVQKAERMSKQIDQNVGSFEIPRAAAGVIFAIWKLPLIILTAVTVAGLAPPCSTKRILRLNEKKMEIIRRK